MEQPGAAQLPDSLSFFLVVSGAGIEEREDPSYQPLACSKFNVNVNVDVNVKVNVNPSAEGSSSSKRGELSAFDKFRQ